MRNFARKLMRALFQATLSARVRSSGRIEAIVVFLLKFLQCLKRIKPRWPLMHFQRSFLSCTKGNYIKHRKIYDYASEEGWAKSESIPSSCLCPIQTDRWFPTQLIQPLVEYETPQRQDRIGSLLAPTHPRLLAARRHHLLTS